MPGQASVIIRNKQWTCSVASTPSELTTGLSGTPEISPDTGMLFDLGISLTQVTISMDGMLFPLDVVFMDSNGIVLGVILGLYPEMVETFQSSMGIRYFLEINAGEGIEISPGDEANIELSETASGWITPVVALAGMVIAGAFMAEIGKALSTAVVGKPEKKPPVYTPGNVPCKLHRPQTMKNNQLNFLPDSPEFLAYTIEDIGYRDKIDAVFQQAIARAKGEQ